MANLVTVASKPCPNCGERSILEVDPDKVIRWNSGEKIQNVWPELTAMERETMQTGYCSQACWDAHFGPNADRLAKWGYKSE